MSLPSLPLLDGALCIDNSFIESFTTCPRKAEYDKLLRRMPSMDKPALSFGTAIHHALEWRYKNCRNETPSVLDEQSQIDLLTEYFTANPQPEDDHRQLNFAVEIIKRYNQKFAVEPWQLLTKETGEVMAELSFALPLMKYKAQEIVYTGRIDLPVSWDSRIIIGDWKTTSTLGDFFFNGQRMSSQYEGYGWSWREITKTEPAGFFVRGIRTKAMPGKPTKGWDNWWDESFSMDKEYFKPGQLDEWFQNTCAHVEEFFWHYERGYMPQRKKACTMYGKCAYYDVCYLQAWERKGELASDKFQDNDWSPLKDV